MIIRTQFNVEIGMSELRYRNERREYRDARDGLLKDEQKFWPQNAASLLLYIRGSPRALDPAAKLQIRIFGRTLSE
jgi:hypothetical protein